MNSETYHPPADPALGHLKRRTVIRDALIRLALLSIAGVLIAIIASTTGRVSDCGTRGGEASNLRQIGQAALIYASDNHDRLPQTDDIHAFAFELARLGGLNDATAWLAGTDACSITGLTTVLSRDRKSLEPAFAAVRPTFAAAVRGLHANLSVTTPIAWTRGLQPDGTWSKDSPYGGEGGHIVFLGGNVRWFRNLKSPADALLRFDGQGPTIDIRAALPPDAVIANN